MADHIRFIDCIQRCNDKIFKHCQLQDFYSKLCNKEKEDCRMKCYDTCEPYLKHCRLQDFYSKLCNKEKEDDR